jgi:hypothetical protein
MPWKPGSARRFTKAASSPAKKKQWAKTANAALRAGKSEGAAVRIANAAVRKR